MGCWRRYWFPDGGRASAGAVRIAVAVSMLWTLVRLGDNHLVAEPGAVPADLYHPVGILMVLGSGLPPPVVIEVAQVLAWLGVLGLLVGAWTRTAAAIGLVASLVIASWSVSFSPSWSHDHNLPLLALIAVQGTQAGDVIGIDGWRRRRRGLAAPPANGFAWTARLVQLTAALMFLSAAVSKLGAGYFTLRWALSDNLRHQLLAQFDMNHLPRTAAADWLLVAPWRYQTAALLNVASQIAPTFACVFVSRPLVRVALGSFFAIESIGIGVVMGLWNPHWIPLFAAFVDWDRLVAWWRSRRGGDAVADPRAPTAVAVPGRHRTASAFIAVFIACDVLISFAYPRIDHAIGSYPFSAFPMFSAIRAKAPYDRHQTYEFAGGRFELLADRPVPSHVVDRVHAHIAYRKMHLTTDGVLLRTRMYALLADVQQRFPEHAIRGVRLWATSYQVPAHPAPAVLIPHDLGVLGEIDVDGRWFTALGRLVRDGDRWQLIPAAGVELASLVSSPLAVHVDAWPESQPVTPRVEDGRILLDLPAGRLVHVVARLGDGPTARRVVVGRAGFRAR